jgi:protein TonB
VKYKTNVFAILAVLVLLGAGYAQQNQTNPNPDNQKAAAQDSELKVLHRVPPIYPPEAKANGIEGTVVLEAVVDKQGNVAKAKVVSGPQILADAAVEAIKAWKFAPATSKGQPVEKTTQIKVTFCENAGHSCQPG